MGKRLDWLGLVIRVGLGVVFLFASVPKLSDPYANVQAVKAYELLPAPWFRWVGYGQPMVELLIGLCLLVGLLTRVSGALATLLFAAFIFISTTRSLAVAQKWTTGRIVRIDLARFPGVVRDLSTVEGPAANGIRGVTAVGRANVSESSWRGTFPRKRSSGYLEVRRDASRSAKRSARTASSLGGVRPWPQAR